MAGDPDAALPDQRVDAAMRSTPPPSATAPTASSTALTDFAGNVRLHARSTRSWSTTTRRPTPARSPGRRRRLAPHQRLRPRLGEPRPGSGKPDRRRLLADLRPGRLRHRRPVRRRPRPSQPSHDLSVPAAGAYALQLWLRDEAGNEAPGSAVTVPLRFDDVRPEVGFSTDAAEAQVRADVDDAHSGPAAGKILYRRVDAEAWTELPTKLVAGRPARVAHLVAPMPELGPAPTSSAPTRPMPPATPPRPRCAPTAPQMAIRRVPPPHVPKAPRVKTRLFARLRGGHGRGESLTVPFGAPALLSGRLTRRRRGRPRRPTSAGRRPALARGADPGRRRGRRDRRAGRLRAAAAARSLAADHGHLRRRRRLGAGGAATAGAAGPRRRSRSAPTPRACGRARRCGSAAG